jgi:hypothetical protein
MLRADKQKRAETKQRREVMPRVDEMQNTLNN